MADQFWERLENTQKLQDGLAGLEESLAEERRLRRLERLLTAILFPLLVVGGGAAFYLVIALSVTPIGTQ